MGTPTELGPRTGLFWVLTGVYAAAVVIGAGWLGYLDPDGEPITPNEWGDVLAGVFSPLAFLWLVYAALAQRAELEMQRNEIRKNNLTQDRQREEMSKQVEALQAQAELLAAQANATYDPLLVTSIPLVATSASGAWLVSIRLQNLGGDMANVLLDHRLQANEMTFPDGREGIDLHGRKILSHWPKGGRVTFFGIDLPATAEDVVIAFQRLDTLHKMNTYAIRDGGYRIDLVSSEANPNLTANLADLRDK